MIEALEFNNIQLLLDKYFKGEDLYPTIVGVNADIKQASNDAQKQMNLADWTSRLAGDIFLKGYSPHETYMAKDDFCRAISKDFNINNIGHRLYFNFTDDKVDFLTLFMNGCMALGVPFCAKFNKNQARKDNFVIYVEQDKLDETAKVLQGIVDRFPQFAEKKDFPMSVIKGGWFGYSQDKPGDINISYNRKVANCINKAFFDVNLFNKYRHFFSIKNSLTEFSSALFEQVKLEYISNGGEMDLFVANEDSLRGRFDDLKLQLALQFFSGEERRGSGFVSQQKLDGVVGMDNYLRQVKSAISDYSIGISSEAVLRTILQQIRNGAMTFSPEGDEYINFVRSMSENIRDELSKAGLSVTMPVELQGLINLTNNKGEFVM